MLNVFVYYSWYKYQSTYLWSLTWNSTFLSLLSLRCITPHWELLTSNSGGCLKILNLLGHKTEGKKCGKFLPIWPTFIFWSLPTSRQIKHFITKHEAEPNHHFKFHKISWICVCKYVLYLLHDLEQGSWAGYVTCWPQLHPI